jgi:hypothetical protein
MAGLRTLPVLSGPIYGAVGHLPYGRYVSIESVSLLRRLLPSAQDSFDSFEARPRSAAVISTTVPSPIALVRLP